MGPPATSGHDAAMPRLSGGLGPTRRILSQPIDDSGTSIRTNTELVYEHIKNLPESTVGEVLDLVEFLERKQRTRPCIPPGAREDVKGPRPPGSARRQPWMAPDFDEPLEGFKGLSMPPIIRPT
jgi:hypothetical protein